MDFDIDCAAIFSCSFRYGYRKNQGWETCRFTYLLYRGQFDKQQEIEIFPCDRQCRVPCHLLEGKQILVFSDIAKKKAKIFLMHFIILIKNLLAGIRGLLEGSFLCMQNPRRRKSMSSSGSYRLRALRRRLTSTFR
jgi:hypothetical protein